MTGFKISISEKMHEKITAIYCNQAIIAIKPSSY